MLNRDYNNRRVHKITETNLLNKKWKILVFKISNCNIKTPHHPRLSIIKNYASINANSNYTSYAYEK